MKLLTLIPILFFVGCASQPKIAPLISKPVAVPDVAAHQVTIEAQRTINEQTKQASANVSDSLGKASTSAAELLRIAPVDLRPLVEKLTVDLQDARLQLGALNDTLKLSEANVIKLMNEAERLKAQTEAVEQQRRQTAETAMQLEKALQDERGAMAAAKEKIADKQRWLYISWAVAVFTSALALFAFRARVPFI